MTATSQTTLEPDISSFEAWAESARTDQAYWQRNCRFSLLDDFGSQVSTEKRSDEPETGFRFHGFFRRPDGSVDEVRGYAASTAVPPTLSFITRADATDRVVTSEPDPALQELFASRQRTYTAQIAQRYPVSEARQAVLDLFRNARDEFFEDGIDSEFSRGLISMVNRYGDFGVSALAGEILNLRGSEEAASEALRWIGRIRSEVSRGYRRWLLERSLFSTSPKIRDGAVLGLASMADPLSASELKRAASSETVEPIRQDILELLAQLEDTD